MAGMERQALGRDRLLIRFWCSLGMMPFLGYLVVTTNGWGVVIYSMATLYFLYLVISGVIALRKLRRIDPNPMD